MLLSKTYYQNLSFIHNIANLFLEWFGINGSPYWLLNLFLRQSSNSQLVSKNSLFLFDEFVKWLIMYMAYLFQTNLQLIMALSSLLFFYATLIFSFFSWKCPYLFLISLLTFLKLFPISSELYRGFYFFSFMHIV